MSKLNSKYLLNSKWTAVEPKGREKHFMVTRVQYDEQGTVISCELEAIVTGRLMIMDWHDLTRSGDWIQGWK